MKDEEVVEAVTEADGPLEGGTSKFLGVRVSNKPFQSLGNLGVKQGISNRLHSHYDTLHSPWAGTEAR